MGFTFNPKFNQAIVRFGLPEAFHRTVDNTGLAEYLILRAENNIGGQLQRPVVTALYDAMADKSDYQTLRLLRVSKPEVVVRFLESSLLSQPRHISSKLCDDVVALLDATEPDWWHRPLSLTTGA
jgi:hypothetical protein